MKQCNFCQNENFIPYLEVGRRDDSPSVRNSLLSPSLFSFSLHICKNCFLIQIENPLCPTLLYSDAPHYLTSFQKPKHLEELLTSALAYHEPIAALEIGCNDGGLLETLTAYNYAKIIGIEPNKQAAQLAQQKGYKVYNSFLDKITCDLLLRKEGKFDIIYLRHVAEHISNLKEFFINIRKLLKKEGIIVCEWPYIEPNLTQGNPAFLWEEHVNYFTELFSEHLLQRMGFKVLEKRYYGFGGGSLAFIAQLTSFCESILSYSPSPLEKKKIEEFPSKLFTLKTQLHSLISTYKKQEYVVVLYGIGSRSGGLIKGLGLHNVIDYVIDDRVIIQGKILTHIDKPISSYEELKKISAPLLCLLAVGADKEYIIKRKLKADKKDVTYVSLLPPKNSFDSINKIKKKKKK